MLVREPSDLTVPSSTARPTLTKRYAHGLYLLAGYTFAHAIDTATSNLAFVPQNSLNYQGDRGNGDYDIRHRFTLSATYDIPGRQSEGANYGRSGLSRAS